MLTLTLTIDTFNTRAQTKRKTICGSFVVTNMWLYEIYLSKKNQLVILSYISSYDILYFGFVVLEAPK